MELTPHDFDIFTRLIPFHETVNTTARHIIRSCRNLQERTAAHMLVGDRANARVHAVEFLHFLKEG